MEDTKKFLENKEISPQERIDSFCKICWTVEEPVQEELFEILKNSFSGLSDEEKISLIPKLEKASSCYNPMIVLAYDLFVTLPPWKHRQIEIPVIWWSIDDRYTQITVEEYKWRRKHNLSCKESGGLYTRPSRLEDFLCFEKSVRMTMLTNSNFVFLE